MRIDRIRITSLASLHGPQPTVDLNGPILGQAGLVAITGPTGSGKSTLLDGLSLALFGCTPRLGRDTDHLLSRDAVEGGAEVVFTLDDGSRWIATWSAHRSRKQLDGIVQSASHQIARADDGGIAASGAKEVKAWVDRHLRLSFDQFCGVMLLAQFDFARFLVADDKDRSLLLEKLTGTDLYARLSTAAFERSKAAQERVQQHQLTLAGLEPLPAEARAAVEQAVAEGVPAAAGAEAAWAAAQAIVGWWSARRRLEEGLAQRQQAAAAAARAWDEAGPQRQRLAAAEAAAQFHPELARIDEARVSAARAQQQLDACSATRQLAIAGLQRCVLGLAQAASTLSATTSAAAAAAASADPLARVGDEELALAREALVQERERTRQLAGLRQLAGRKQAAASVAAAAAAAELGRRQAAAQQCETAASALARAQAVRAAVLAGSDSAALGEQAALAGEAGEVARAAQRLDPAAASAAQAHGAARLVDLEARAAAADAAAVLALRQVELAEQQKRRAESLAAIADFAHLLEDGRPCPLCGAAQHPHPAVAGSTLAAEADAQLAQAVSQRSSAEAAAKQAATAVADARGEVVRLAAAAERVAAEQQQLRGRWAALAARLPVLPAQPDAAAAGTLATALAERLSAARQAEAECTAAQDGLRSAEAALAASDRGHAAAQVAQQQAEAACVEAVAALAVAEGELAAAQTAVVAAVAQLAMRLGEPMPAVADGWLEALPGRVAAARAIAEQARLLSEAEDDLGAQARQLLPAGIAAPPSAVASDPRAAIAGLRQAIASHRTAQAEAEQAGQATLAAQRAVADAAAATAVHLGALAGLLASGTFADESTLRAALLPQQELQELRQRIQRLQHVATASQDEASRALQALAEQSVPAGVAVADPDGMAAAEAALASAQAHRDAVRDRLQRDRQAIADDDQRRRQRACIEAEAGPLLAAARQAAALSELIGSRDGARFRRFAQALTLDQLVVLANHRLTALAPRYQLLRTRAVVGQDPSLGLEIIDLEQAEAQRPVATLSGGETFLVSLALALALADLKRGGLRLGTLFIDEGFGSLDPATLERCLAILERLQQEQGTQIVVISHVGALHERLAHRIEVRPQGNGRSRLRISGPAGVVEDAPPAASSPAAGEALYDALPPDGAAVSSRALRRTLGWDEDAFRQAVAGLLQAARIEQPPGTKSLRRRARSAPGG